MAGQQPFTARVVVEFDPSGHPVCGQLVPSSGTPRAFAGWLELTRALEILIVEATAGPTAGPAPPGR